jgi:hypothetical protein
MPQYLLYNNRSGCYNFCLKNFKKKIKHDNKQELDKEFKEFVEDLNKI